MLNILTRIWRLGALSLIGLAGCISTGSQVAEIEDPFLPKSPVVKASVKAPANTNKIDEATRPVVQTSLLNTKDEVSKDNLKIE